jgi:hypothetical protein
MYKKIRDMYVTIVTYITNNKHQDLIVEVWGSWGELGWKEKIAGSGFEFSDKGASSSRPLSPLISGL